MAPTGSWARRYQELATILLNTLIIFAVLNVIAWAFLWFKVKRYGNDPVSAKYGPLVERSYPDMNGGEVRELLRETWSRGFQYEPFTYFRERPFAGKYVNVDPHGFRLTKGQGPWPPDREKYFVIFLFGGSTSFAYGLPDDQTVASYLQESLSTRAAGRAPRIYNFGQAYYYSSQERIQYERLLAAGYVPDMALFVDGLNEYYRPDDNPEFGTQLAAMMDTQNASGFSWRQLAKRIPLVEAAILARGAVRGPTPVHQEYDDPWVAHRIADRYVQDIKVITAVSAAYGVEPMFVWQPVPTYRCDPRADPFSGEDQFGPAYAKYGYPVMAEYRQSSKLGSNFVWCADVQDGITTPLYVDKIHYSAALSKLLAGCISAGITSRPALAK